MLAFCNISGEGLIVGSFAILKDFFRRHAWRYAAGILCLVFVDFLQLFVPKILGQLTDDLSKGVLTGASLWRYVGIMAGLAVLISIGRYAWRMLVMGAARLLDYDLRNRLFTHLESLSQNYFNNRKTGDLMAHATNDVGAVRQAFGQGIVMTVDAGFLIVIVIAIMIGMDWRLTVTALLPLPFLAAVVAGFGRVIHNRFKKVQEAFSSLTDRAQEDFAGIRVIKAFVQEKHEIGNFTQVNRHYLDRNMSLVKVWGLFGPLVQFISALSFVIVLGYGSRLVMDGTITLGDFVAFNGYLRLLMWPMMAIGFVINLVQRGAASMARLSAIFQEKPEITDAPDVAPISALSGGIEFRHLTFTYPGTSTPALKDINLVIPEGKTLAIVGRTGSGKTTLANLILRLYNPAPGRLLIDGIDILQLPINVLRKDIGYVPQDNFLFSATVAENVAFGGDGFRQEEVEGASRIAQVHDNIMDFPEGYRTLVGERGVTLSGGQKQRVSIARAVIKNPKILILDDCLSAVDTNTEELILKRLRDVMATRTSIIISHRISTIQRADEIVVLDDGLIVERGTHDELIAANGLYTDIYRKQLLEEELEAQEAGGGR